MVSKKIYNKFFIYFTKDTWNKKIPIFFNLKIFKYLFSLYKRDNIWYLDLRKKECLDKYFKVYNYNIVFIGKKLPIINN